MSTAATNILVVEDEAALRELVVEELAAADYVVQAAANGREALDRLASSPPDLVLSDIRMPELDGFGLLETMRAHFPTLAATPFIFLTALADREQMLAGLGAGAEDYITKPIDFDLLLLKVQSRVREAARRRRRGAPGANPLPLPAATAPAPPPPPPPPSATATAPAPRAHGVISLANVRARLGAAWPKRGGSAVTTEEQRERRHPAPEDAAPGNAAADVVDLHAHAPSAAAAAAQALAARGGGQPAGEDRLSAVRAITPAAYAGEPAPPTSVAGHLAQALDARLDAAQDLTQTWLDELAQNAELRAVAPETAEREASRLRYVRLDAPHEARLDDLRRSGAYTEAHAAQVEAILLYRFLVSTGAAFNAPGALYVLPVSRQLVRTTPLFAVAERVFAKGLAGRRDRLLLSLPASFHRSGRMQTRLQELLRYSRGISVHVDDIQAAWECFADPNVRVFEIDGAMLGADAGQRGPAFRALVEEARSRRRLVLAGDVAGDDSRLRAQVFAAGVHLVREP